MKTIRICLGLVCAAAFAAPVSADQLTEGFDNIGTLSGSGWSLQNNSSPVGQSWFQGNDGIFTAQSGATNSYIAADYLSTAPLGGDISLWLITPQVTLQNGVALNFYTRTDAGSIFPDRLEVRSSSNGASTNVGSSSTSVGDFTNLLLTINPALVTSPTAGAYPESWSLFSVIVSGISSPVSGRFAFRYFVTDTTTNGNYIGIDSVSVSDVAPVPLPASAWLLLSALAGLLVISRRGRLSAVIG